MRLKENSLLLPARFLLGRKKGRAKSHVYYLDLWHTLLVDSEISFLFLLCRGSG